MIAETISACTVLFALMQSIPTGVLALLVLQGDFVKWISMSASASPVKIRGCV